MSNLQEHVQTRDEMYLPGDHLVIATALQGQVRAVAVRSTQTVQTLTRIHDLSPLAAIAAGRLAAGTQLLLSDLKNETDSLTVSVKGDGPLGGILMAGDASGYVRGYVHHPRVEAEPDATRSAVARAVGAGNLTVVRSTGLKEPWSGTVKLVSGEIAEDLTYYLAVSEQIPSLVSLGVQISATGVAAAGGLLVQLMPGATEKTISYLEQRAGGGFPPMTFLLEEGFTPAQIIDLFLGDPQVRYLEKRPVGFRCTCSRRRMERNLLTLSRTELEELAADPQGIRLDCHFCNRSYHFDQDEVRALL